MSEIEKSRERFRAAHEASARWGQQRQRMEAERDRLRAEIPVLERQATEAENAKALMLARYVGGDAEQIEVSTARNTVAAAQDRLAEAQELLEAVIRGIDQHYRKQMEVGNELTAAKRGYCDELAKPLIEGIGGSRKIRDELLNAFVGWSASENGPCDFNLFLAQVFPAPREDEKIEARVQAFNHKYIDPITRIA